MWEVLKVVIILAAVKHFILDALGISVQLTNEATITAVICATVVFCVIVSMAVTRRK